MRDLATKSKQHPHEPSIPAALDDEGRCRVCQLLVRLAEGQFLVEEMDRRMPEQATEDADGFINSYRIPVGPWHRLLAWARS